MGLGVRDIVSSGNIVFPGNILFPEKCILCGKLLTSRECGVCVGCRRKLPVVTEPFCKRCGKPVMSAETEYCFDCNRKKGSLAQGRAVWVYDREMKKAMAGFKETGCRVDTEFYAGEFLAHWGEQLAVWAPERVIPVPLHWRKRWFRGFNQSAELAEAIGRKAGIKVLPEALVRSRPTCPQKGLDNRQRKKNLQGAFTVHDKFRGELSQCRRVLLVDDIYTTGATLEECSNVIRNLGVQKVYSACLCIGRDY